MVALLGTRELLALINDRLFWKTRVQVNFKLLQATVERLHSLPLSFHREESVGATMTKMERGIAGAMTAFTEVVVQQRIAIARTLLKNAPILILDEATSALDAESECKVQCALGRLAEGRTTFVIAHRLATVTSADRIVVFKGGGIAEIGTHETLMRWNGYYSSLVKQQLGGLAAPSGPVDPPTDMVA